MLLRILLSIVVASIMACGHQSPAIGASAALPTSDIITKGPWVDVRAFSNFSTAKVYAESVGKPLHVTTPVSANNLTVKCEVDVLRGGYITINTGKTLTFGAGSDFRAGDNHHALRGAGAVVGLKRARPEWMGAKGDWDGSTGTDDTVAIQRANNAAKTILWLRKGYKITDEIVLNPTDIGGNGGWRWVGDGNANSVTSGTYIHQATSGKYVFVLGDAAGLVYDQQSQFSDMGFTGVSGAKGCKLAMAEDTVFARCKFSAMSRGIEFATAANAQVIKPRIHDCRFQSLDYGIFASGTRTGDVWIERNTFINNRLTDIHMTGAPDGGYVQDNFFGQDNPAATPSSKWIVLQQPVWIEITGNHFYNCALTGVELQSPRNCTVERNQFYRSSQLNSAGFALYLSRMDNGTSPYNGPAIFGNKVIDNTFYEAYYYGLRADEGMQLIIEGNHFVGVGKGAPNTRPAITLSNTDKSTVRRNTIIGSLPETYLNLSTTAGVTTATVNAQLGTPLAVGMAISGKGLPNNTTVTAADSAVLAGGTGSITLSAAPLQAASSQPMVAGTRVTQYPMVLADCSFISISDNILHGSFSQPYYTSVRAISAQRNINPVTYTTTATATIDDDTIYVTASSPWTLTLQNAVNYLNKRVTIIKTDANANLVTVNGGGSTINGVATYTGLSAQYKRITLIPDGTNWLIENSN